MLDPCAGDGEAILALRDLWVRQWASDGDETTPHQRERPTVVACEMEAERADTLRQALTHYRDRAYHGDALRLLPDAQDSARATVLYLNPPYDQDREYGRTEQRFLARFTPMLHPGSGCLLFLVPAQALPASADYLARHFLDLKAWRLPDPDFQAFRQVLVVARRTAKPLTDTCKAETIRGWAEKPLNLPELPEVCPEPLGVDLDPHPHYHLGLHLDELDVTAALDAFRPFDDEAIGLADETSELLGAKFETAVPPKPAHIALALSSGMFNGWPLEPNNPSRHPPVLAKGVFEREHVPVSERTDKEGEVTGIVEIEQPRLRLTVLRLDDLSFQELSPGTIPAGGDDPSGWNAADLIVNYDRSLARLLGQQFPALHDPADPEHAIALPPLARTPYKVQALAVQASLKLLATGRNPMLVAEVGTGKTTMALAIAAALSPGHYEHTVAELERFGISGKPPRVEKTLIVCPPHLLGTWEEEAQAVVPGWRVQVVRRAEDLARPAELYVLSRETAKLGHGLAGVAGRCPRCGGAVETKAASNASRRLRCKAVPRTPVTLAARLAEWLAALLLPAIPENPLLRTLVRAPALERRFHLEADPRPLSLEPVKDLGLTLARKLARLASPSASPDEIPQSFYRLTTALEDLAGLLGLEREVLAILEQATTDPPQWLRLSIETLSHNERHEEQRCPSEDVLPALLRVAEQLRDGGEWLEGPPCGEPLYQAVPEPRRIPLAEIIQRRHRRDFRLVILDEAHEFAHRASAQSKAAHRLSGLPEAATVILTGSLMGGYASSLFTNFWHLSPLFRREFERSELGSFLLRYGYRKTLREPEQEESRSSRRGRYTDRDLDGRQTLGEAPGVMPTFILRHLLPTAVLVHKDDLDCELPRLSELPAPLEPDPDDPLDSKLLAEYRRIQAKVLTCVRRDRFIPDRSGRLLGALVELPSYLDRATDDLPPFEVRYPEALGGQLVTRGESFPASWKTPKERWLLAELAQLLGRGEKVLLFLRHTGSAHLPRRLIHLIRDVTPKVAWLDASKVSTAKRQAWIDRHVIEPGIQVLLVNPNAVRTGLNNLVSFSTGLWYQLDWSATTYRQANGRLHRIGQTRPVTVEVPYYADTAQEIAFDLVSKKVGASLQVDGLDLQAALEAAGASSDHTTALATAMSLGQAVYEALTAGASPSPKRPQARPAPQLQATPPVKPFPKIERTTATGTQLSLLELM